MPQPIRIKSYSYCCSLSLVYCTAKWDANRRAVGTLTPVRDKNGSMFILGGRRGDACEQCTSCSEGRREYS